jgi:hypothetical protein
MYTEKQIKEHVEFLRAQLIPDLKESGHHNTAADFARCAAMIGQMISKPPDHRTKLTIEFNDDDEHMIWDGGSTAFVHKQPERFESIGGNEGIDGADTVIDSLVSYEKQHGMDCAVMLWAGENYLNAKFLQAYLWRRYEAGATILWDTLNEEFVVWANVVPDKVFGQVENGS